jgi:4-hydroxy-3-methylbut-2-en-1-yl diphosphate reductase
VDTTCGSVLNVWKRVDQYARDGFTALVHGKYYHEETKATASQVFKHPGGPS